MPAPASSEANEYLYAASKYASLLQHRSDEDMIDQKSIIASLLQHRSDKDMIDQIKYVSLPCFSIDLIRI